MAATMQATGQYAVGSPFVGTPVGYQQISATTLASATGLTVPPNAKYALLQVDTATVRYMDNGVAPTAAIGIQLFNSIAPFLYAGNLNAIQFILVSGSPVLNIAYYA